MFAIPGEIVTIAKAKASLPNPNPTGAKRSGGI
jgi:hypothetical protein